MYSCGTARSRSIMKKIPQKKAPFALKNPMVSIAEGRSPTKETETITPADRPRKNWR